MNKKTVQMYFTSPVHQALFSTRLFETGMGNAILARRTAGNANIGVVFLCDHYCLGVKDLYACMENEAGYASLLRKIMQADPLEAITPEYLKTYVVELVNWARSIGFQPQGDYKFCSGIFSDIPRDTGLSFEFGHNGSPLYINGPNDTPQRIQSIMTTLEASQEKTGNKADVMIGGPASTIDALPQHIELPG